MFRRSAPTVNTVRSFAKTTAYLSRGDGVKSYEEMPGPPSVPILGSSASFLWEARKEPFGKLFLSSQIRDHKKYEVRRSTKKYEAASEIMRSEPKYPKRFDSPIMDHYRETRQAIPGVFFANGPDWHKYRSVISKRMLRPREVADYSSVFSDISSEFLARMTSIRGAAGGEHENEVQGLDNELFKWSFESVAYLLFDRRFGCLGEDPNPHAEDMIKSIGAFLGAVLPVSLLPVWFFTKIYKTKTYRDFIYHFDKMYHYAELFTSERIQELEHEGKLNSELKNGEQLDFFRYLLSSGKLTKEDFLATVIDVLFAGVDTTSNTMQWVLYMMGTHPDKQEKLYREVTSIVPPGQTPTTEDIAKMPYLKAWLKETLRLYPVLGFLSRQFPHDINLLGYRIPAGVNLSIHTYFMTRDEENFEDPLEFKPERWLREDHAAEAIHAFASLPFGFGTRMCVGRRIAELELHLLMVKTVQRFSIHYPHEDKIEPFMRGVIIPDKPVRVQFIDRPDIANAY